MHRPFGPKPSLPSLLIHGLRLEAQRLPSSPSGLGDLVIGSIETTHLNIKKSQAVSPQTQDFMISRLKDLNHQCPNNAQNLQIILSVAPWRGRRGRSSPSRP